MQLAHTRAHGGRPCGSRPAAARAAVRPAPASSRLAVPRALARRDVNAASIEEQTDVLEDEEEVSVPHSQLPEFCDPEDFVLAPGELSAVDRDTPLHESDVYVSGPETAESSGRNSDDWRNEEGGYLKAILTAKVYEVAIESPLQVAEKLSAASGNTIMLKREDLQPVKSFKLRGAYNKMAALTPEQRAKGVICSSAGNHAQGVALSAAKLGCNGVICMPQDTPSIKVDAVRALGGEVRLVGASYQETQSYATAAAREEGRVFVAPYDDPYTIAGQGTIGVELLRQLGSRVDELDAVVVAVGGGGLIAGIGAYLKALKPDIKIIGAEPVGANAMAQSLAKGRRVFLNKVDSFADGVAVKQVGKETFRVCREVVDGVVLVDNAAVSAAIKDVFNEERSILEPAGAVAVAGAKAYLSHAGLKGKTVVAVTSGANMNFDRLRLVADLADIGGLREAMVATTIPEEPGAFLKLVELMMEASLQFTEFKYRFNAGSPANILFSVGIRQQSDLTDLLARMREIGFEATDISNMKPVQMHLRHLVGGRARSYTGEIPYEKIYQVEFPEKVGALQTFLEQMSPAFNVTLFHYRNMGNTTTKLLMGLQVPPAEQAKFDAAVAFLEQPEKGFSFETLDGETERVFKMFLL